MKLVNEKQFVIKKSYWYQEWWLVEYLPNFPLDETIFGWFGGLLNSVQAICTLTVMISVDVQRTLLWLKISKKFVKWSRSSNKHVDNSFMYIWVKWVPSSPQSRHCTISLSKENDIKFVSSCFRIRHILWFWPKRLFTFLGHKNS